jgi:hypothetical protein
MDAMEVYTKLDRIRKIRDKDVVVITIGHELEDVVEVFSRLNSRGTRVTEADIYLGVVAARNPGWVRETFLPYLHALGEAGFAIDPNLLFRTMTGVASRRSASGISWIVSGRWSRSSRLGIGLQMLGNGSLRGSSSSAFSAATRCPLRQPWCRW